MTLALPGNGLYVLTPVDMGGDTLRARVRLVLQGGAVAVQYRAKNNAGRADAQMLAELCHAAGRPLIVNDDPELARAVGADGVHIGADDVDYDRARTIVGADAIIGVSCYASLERALDAQARGADYVAFGSFFPSRTKPAAVPAQLELLRMARARLRLPIVVIGGITARTAPALLAAGADLVAVSDAVFSDPDPLAAARSIAVQFTSQDASRQDCYP